MANVEKAAPQGTGDIHIEQPPAYSYGAASAAEGLPTYEQHQASLPPVVDSSEPPPSYDSIFGQVKAARAESSSILDFFKKFLTILLGTIGCTVFVGIILAVPISMIVMGSIYVNDCPFEHYIPIYLIVGGCFGIVKNVSSMVQRVRNKRENRDEENARTNPFDGVLNCFLLAWFIAGNVWIYRSNGKFSTDPASGRAYCNPILYAYAFWLTTSTYIVIATTCCCICLAGCLCGRQQADS